MVNYNDNAFLMGVSNIKHLYNIAQLQCNALLQMLALKRVSQYF